MAREVCPPLIGDPLPTMVVHTTYGKRTLPEDYRGQWLILFSHPGDFTPVCTTEFVSFEKYRRIFKKMNCQLLGLSIDDVFAHLKWVEWIRQCLGVKIRFPIIADPLGKVARKLGMVDPKRGTRTIRSVFFINPQGTISLILSYPENIGRNIKEIVRALHALQTSAAQKVNMPANWPNNELIGACGILSPANSVQQIRERMKMSKAGKIKCFDWWFCYKDLI